jgi:hypothetical protein
VFGVFRGLVFYMAALAGEVLFSPHPVPLQTGIIKKMISEVSVI